MSSAECLQLAKMDELDLAPKVAYCIDPLQDSRWDDLVRRHPRASIFHCSPWLETLSRTYGYQPVVYTTSPAGQELENGIVFCRVESWLTGRRLVSLPFSDHCEPLVDSGNDMQVLASAIEGEVRQRRLRYAELRPLECTSFPTTLGRAIIPYNFHQLDLAPDLATIFGNFHKSSIQRKIHRAERERLQYREGTSPELLHHFHRLLGLTRKRHHLPPQPRVWFENLMECFGEALKIRVAFHRETAVAAMMTICHKETMVYKYGASDKQFSNLGGMHLLFWKAIEEAKISGLRYFDFGRTDAGQDGLVTFKNRWGATHSTFNYFRFCASDGSTHSLDLSTSTWKSRAAKYVFSHLPASLLSFAGEILYRHSA